MTILHALILGVIEGLTEFLPISSTAHMIIAAEWLKIPQTEFLKTFEISIQLGAILAIVILYWKKIWSSWSLIGKLVTAFIPTAIIGLLFYKIVKSYLMNNNHIIASALLLGGIILIIFEKYYSKKTSRKELANFGAEAGNNEIKISYKQAAIIGVFQALAIVPGVSRAAATIIGGLSLGVNRKNIVEFSFLLAIPTMLAATGLDLLKSRDALMGLGSHDLLIWLIGFIASFITAIIGVKFFMKYIQKNNFSAFGWYRVILGALIFFILFI
ncbi:MAG: undecaprenyl-diphosphatase UppP [Candidatus Falkowbacteria bacterium]